MKSAQTCFSGLVVLLLLAGCAQATALPTNPPQATDIPAATLTPVPNATKTVTQTITPIPPPTRRATSTSDPNSTATPTPIASFTRQPTSKASKTITATVTGTNTMYVRPPNFGGPTWTPSKPDFACTFDDNATYPVFGQVFTPREDFVAYWKVFNSGENMWHKDDIIFDFIDGTKMNANDRGGQILDTTIYVGDHLVVQMHMKPPKEPGIYTTNWGFRKTNKKEFFCKLSVTIEIRKKQ